MSGTTIKARLGRAAARYMQFLEYFIPEDIKKDREAGNQARMFLISHSMGPILGNAVPITVLLFNPTLRLDAIVLFLAITAFWIFPFLLKRGFNYERLVLVSVVNLNFCILWSCYFYGGVASPTLPWLLTIPILSLFYIGGQRKLQPHLLAIAACSFVLFLVVYNVVPPPAINMPTFAVYALGVVSTTAALCYVATMAIYYARIFDAGLALEEEVRKRRETTDELRREVANADRAGSAKSEFLARMSHELRSPLNAIIGYSQIVREDAHDSGDAALLEDIDRISGAGQYLLRLVDMILDLSKLEAGRMRFNVQPHSLGRLVEQAMSRKRELIEAGGNAVALDFAPGMPNVSVDASRFCQMLDAIIENAAEHTRGGTITIRSFLSAADQTFSVTVSDTGDGIDKDTLAALFETFTTRREAGAGRFGGTGLNMSVVYRLCRAMGGNLSVQSEPGRGSSFTITMPVAATEASERAASTPVVLPVAA